MALEPVNEGEEAVSAGEVQFEDDDVVITEKRMKEILAGDTVPEGDYLCLISNLTLLAPSADKIGGVSYKFKVQEPLGKQQMPADGWPVLGRLFKKWLNPDEGQQQSQRFDNADETKLFAACGVQPPYKPREARQAVLGRSIIVNVSHKADKKTKELRQNLGNFRPMKG